MIAVVNLRITQPVRLPEVGALFTMQAQFVWLQAVYEEDMVHRNPGDASTLAGIEQPFDVTKAWVQGEASAPTAGNWTPTWTA